MSVFQTVKVWCTAPDCDWTGRRKEPEAQWWRNRETPTCPKCGNHPVRYARPKKKAS